MTISNNYERQLLKSGLYEPLSTLLADVTNEHAVFGKTNTFDVNGEKYHIVGTAIKEIA